MQYELDDFGFKLNILGKVIDDYYKSHTQKSVENKGLMVDTITEFIDEAHHDDFDKDWVDDMLVRLILVIKLKETYSFDINLFYRDEFPELVEG